MKKIYTPLLLALLTINLSAQTPQKISYQFVVRNASGSLIVNGPVGVRVAILQGSPTGTVVYHELFNPNPITNLNGLVSIEIGTGLPITGTFSSINWASGTYYLKTETDPTGGTSYSVVGTSQLISVPYSLYSGATESIPNNSVTSAKIVDGTIITADLANSSITSAKIADGNVANADLSDGSVTSAKIVDGTISSSDIADGSVTTAKILDGTIAATDIANSAITPVKINSTGAVADNVLQYTGSAVSWGYAPGTEVKYTVLNVTCNTPVPLTTNYVKVADIGSFTKLVAGSRLEVTFFGRVQVATFASSTGAIFEIRVDNTATTLGRARAVLRETFAGYGGINVSMSGIFEGFGAGNHTVSVWARTFYGTGTEARVDPGCWQTDHVIVREIM